MSVLLKIVGDLNDDFEKYLAHEIKNTRIKMPNGQIYPMLDLAEDYIYNTGLSFIKSVLKRKTYDVGSVELKFYVIAKNVAALFYAGTKREHKMQALDLLKYI